MMLGQSWCWLALIASHISSTSSSIVTDPAPPAATYDLAAQLFKRQETCPANTFRCNPDLGPAFKDICCQNGQTCALDANNQPACCPAGAVCTGTAPASAATGAPALVVSYVPNAYFSFPYAATTFNDQAACTSAVDACSKNYDTCVTVLDNGAGYGVTIVVPGGGGTTVNGGAGAYGASATPICSSLSSKACSNLEATPCSSYKESGASTMRVNYIVVLGAATVLLRILS